MKQNILLILCALCAFTARGQSVEQLQVQFDAAKTPGAKWAIVQNWANAQAEAAKADKAAMQSKIDALVAKVVAAKTPAELAAVRAEIAAPEREARRAKLAAELAAKQAELAAVK